VKALIGGICSAAVVGYVLLALVNMGASSSHATDGTKAGSPADGEDLQSVGDAYAAELV